MKTDLEEMRWEGVDSSNLVQDRDQWRIHVNTPPNLRVPLNARNFLTDHVLCFKALVVANKIPSKEFCWESRGHSVS